VELLTAVLISWPFWTAIIVVTSVLILRKPFASFVDRLRGFKAWGASLDAGPAEPQTRSEAGTPTPTALLKHEAETAPKKAPRDVVDDVLRHLPRAEYFAMREEQIEQQLGQLGISEDPQQTARVLIALTASASVGNEFEPLQHDLGEPAAHPSHSMTSRNPSPLTHYDGAIYRRRGRLSSDVPELHVRGLHRLHDSSRDHCR
jgi:hypothetical protein